MHVQHRRLAHTVEQVRRAEQELMATLPPGALMARAATGLAVGVANELTARRGRLAGARVLLVVGSGDNGGDALLAGARLARRGVAVRWVQTSERVHRAGAAALTAAGGRHVPTEHGRLPDQVLRWAPDVALDAVVGIGGHPGLGAVAHSIFAQLAERRVPVFAVDLPSGVAVDTGETPLPHVRAEVTFTFGTEKVATLVDPAAQACGEVRPVDIGLDLDGPGTSAAVEAWGAADVVRSLPVPGRADHKYTRGVLGVRAGSATYPGAAVLCVSGANTGLVGMVRYVGPDAVRAEVVRRHPEVVGAGRVQAWTVGSGGAEEAEQALSEALADGVPVVVDADALPHVAAHLTPGHAHRVVLTPHAGELAALLDVGRDAVEAEPWAHARRAAARFGCVVLLKGPRTLVCDPHGRTTVNTTGTPWLATAGAGDVLAGLVGALLASGSSLTDAATAGAWLHGAAAEHGVDGRGGPLVASDLPHGIGEVLQMLRTRVGHSKHEW